MFHFVCAMASNQSGADDKPMTAGGGQPMLPTVGGDRLSMSDYQTLSHLLERAGRESRLGKVLFYSGLTRQTQITQYESKLKGKGPWLYEESMSSQPQTTVQMVQAPTPKAKSVAKKGEDVLATMGLVATVPSGSTSYPLPVPSLPLSGLPGSSVGVEKSGTMPMSGSLDSQQAASSQGNGSYEFPSW